MTGRRFTSNYSDQNAARLEAAATAGGMKPGAFQNLWAMKGVKEYEKSLHVPPPSPKIETWADHMGVNVGPTPSAKAIVCVADLGLKWIQISPERGWFTSAQCAQFITDCHKAGLKVQVCVQEAGHVYAQIIANPAPFAAFARMWADLGADAIAILNEGNNTAFYKPTLDVTMAGIAKITAACVTEIRKESTTVPIYSVGWSPAGGVFAPAEAQKALCVALIKLGFDPKLLSGVGLHPYCYDGPLNFGLPDHEEWNAFSQVPAVYAAGKAAGITGGMALGEYGCPSGGRNDQWPYTTYTEEWQAKVIGEYYKGMDAYRRSGIPIEYLGLSTALDGEASTRPLETTMGVFRVNGTEKPAAAVVRAQGKLAWAL